MPNHHVAPPLCRKRAGDAGAAAMLAAFLLALPAQAQTPPDTFPIDEAELQSLGVRANGVLSPVFHPLTLRYTLSLNNMPVLVQFYPVPSVPGAVVTVDGGSSPIVSLVATFSMPPPDSAGVTATFVVTALDNITTRTYTVRILPAVPPAKPVVNLQPAPLGIFAAWEADHTAQPSISHHDVRYRVKDPRGNWKNAGGDDDENGSSFIYAGSKNWLTFFNSELTAGTEYEVQLRAVNSAVGEWSDLQSVAPAAQQFLVAPLPPTRITLTERDGALIANWASGYSHYTGYRIRWREARSGAAWQAESGADDDGQFIEGFDTTSYLITGLRNETEYVVQIASVTAEVTTVFGSEARAMPTLRVSPPRALPHLEIIASSVAPRVISVRWSPPVGDGAGEITGYRVRWRSVDAGAAPGMWNADDGIPVASNTLVHRIELPADGRYQIEIAAVNSAGRGEWSGVALSTETVIAPHSSDLLSLTLADGDGNAVEFTPAFAATTYEYGAEVGSQVDAVNIAVGFPSTSAPIFYSASDRSLVNPASFPIAPGINYFAIENRTFGRQDLSAYLLTITRIALPAQPPPPAVDSASATSLEVSWVAPQQGSAPLTGYRLRWRTSAATGRAASPWRDASGNNDAGQEIDGAAAASYTIDNLHESISYDVQVRAVSESGPGPWSDIGAGVAASTNADLESFMLGAPGQTLQLPAEFDAAVLTYHAYFERAARAFTLQARGAHSAASVSVDGVELPRNAITEVELAQNGVKRVMLVVTAPDEITSRIYTILANHGPAPPRILQLGASRANDAPALSASWQPGVTSFANAAAGFHMKTADTAGWPSDDTAAHSLPAGVALTADIKWENGVFSATLAGVVADTVYDVRVAGAYIADGINLVGPFSETAQVTSGAQVVAPGVPQNLRVSAGDGRLSLAWTPPATSGGGALSYKARWAQRQAPETWVNDGGEDGADIGAGAGYTITGLAANAIYAVQIAAVNSAGAGAFSDSSHGLAGSFNLEVSLNGGAPDWIDGVLIGRYMLGLRGDALLMPALAGVTADAGEIAAKIEAGLASPDNIMDVDDNGAVNAADGIMIARYLLGVTGDALIAGQTDASDPMKAAEVLGRIAALMPQ